MNLSSNDSRSPSARTVLLIAQRPSDYTEMRRCALALRDRGFNIHFCYHCIYGDITSELPILREIAEFVESRTFLRADMVSRASTITELKLESLSATISSETDITAKPNVSVLEFVKGKLAKIKNAMMMFLFGKIYRIRRRGVNEGDPAWRSVLITILAQLFVVRVYIVRLAAYKRFLKRTQPDIIILPEDVVGLVTPLMIKAGHARNIPSLIVPYTIANQQEAFRSLRSAPNYQATHWGNRPVAALFRQWVMRQDGISLVRLPAGYIIGHVLTRSSPPDPWMMNSGFADAIAVENQAMFDFYKAAGIPVSKMHVVGAAYDDQMSRYLADKREELRRLREELGLQGDKPLLLIGGCPDQSTSCPRFEFKDMQEFAARLFEALSPMKDQFELLVRPHPNYPQLGEMLSRQGIPTTEIDTARLVALSDLYIAFASATIRWAVSCGVPTINYDVFQYDYDDFKDVGGVLTVKAYDDFRSLALQIRQHDSAWKALAEKARQEAPRWGKLDGKSLDRIAQLIERLCETKNVSAAAA